MLYQLEMVISSGKGGTLLINDPRFLDRTEIVREYGTNRSSFFRGEVESYTWIDVGSLWTIFKRHIKGN